ncbi:MAG: pyridoxal phosphate-dependent aminotransferase [Chloroflexi bacterium]|nr:pyridoxal phosphate-dependent aminotransferase [Chloroflexota bacterium]
MFEKLSTRSKNLKPSAIRRFFAVPDDVVSLGIGEPDFDSPPSVIKASHAALDAGKTHYTANSGTAELRQLVSEDLEKRYGVRYNPDAEIIITVGGSEALYLAMASIVDPGDEVIILTPCFVSYQAMVELSGGICVEVPCKFENNFDLDIDAVKAAITPKTKAILFGFPCNPTGAVASREQLQELANLAVQQDIALVSDELYDQLIYGVEHVSVPSLPGAFDRTILIGGFSKNYAMTGFRIGFLAAPAAIMNSCYKIHQYLIMSAPTIAQYGAAAGIRESQADVIRMRDEYNRRRKFVVESLRAAGLPTVEPKGAFYVFPKIADTGLTSEAFALSLLDKFKVAVVPGNGFGAGGEGFVRISYATSYEKLEIAMERIHQFMKSL